MPPPSPGRLDGVDDEQRRVHRKPAKPANAKFTPPKRDLNAPVQKEKRPNNRRDEDKLLINWKEEVGLDEEADDDWLSYADEDEEEE